MDNIFQNSRVTSITNGRIQNIQAEGGTTFVTVSYSDCINCARNTQTVRLVVGSATRVFDENGNQIPVSFLRIGNLVDATFSSAMTRSLPPQATAYVIRQVSRVSASNTTTGLITDINYQNRSFITISNGNPVSVTQFNVPQSARIYDRFGRPMEFNNLRQGMRVFVRHANFMTPSIPPQTTAFEVQVR